MGGGEYQLWFDALRLSTRGGDGREQTGRYRVEKKIEWDRVMEELTAGS